MPDKCLDCPAPSADMDGFIVSGPGGAPRSEGSGVSSPEGPFVREAPQTGHVIIMGTLGADGSPGSLPDAPQVGWAYVAEDPGTYGGVSATEGDIVYCMSLNPVKWGVLQADSDDSGRDLVSVSASFECREEPVQLPLCFYIRFGYHWDDGETEGWSDETDVSQAEGFYLASGTEAKLASLSYPYTGGTLCIYASLGDVVGDYDLDPSGLSADRKASPSPSVLYSAAAGSVYDPFCMDLGSFSVGDSMPVVFDGLVSFTAGQSSRTRSETSGLSADPAPVPSSLLGPYTVSLRIVREADDADGSHFSVYATAVSAAAGASAPVLTLLSVKADGTSSVQVVDMSCLNDRVTSVSASLDCEAPSGQFSPYSPQSCRFYGYSYAGEEPVEAPLTDYSLSGSSLSFTWESDNALHVIVELDGVRVDIPVSAADSAAAGDVFEGSSGGVLVRMTFVSRTDLAAATTYVFSLSSAPAGPVLSLTSTDASGAESIQTADMSCLVPPVFDGSVNGLVPVNSPATQTADLLSDDGTWMRPVSNAEIDALFAE